MSQQSWMRFGAISGGLAVAAGAFGAHALETRLSPRLLAAFETGVRYQMAHALALLVVGLLVANGHRSRNLDVAGWAFTVGTILFSGSLYILALTGQRGFGAITPIGGVAFLIGWASLATHPFISKN